MYLNMASGWHRYLPLLLGQNPRISCPHQNKLNKIEKNIEYLNDILPLDKLN